MDNKFVFDNGLKLVHKQMDYTRSVSVGIFFNVGSSVENDENNGISHFIEHMYFKGTKRRSPFQIAEDIDKLGAQINAFTSKEMTAFYTISIDENFEKCLEILSDILFESTFSEEEMEKEKNVVLEEISMTEDTPDDLASELLFSAFFNGHSLSRPILGSRKNIKSFTRENLLDFISDFYTSKNAVVSIAGNIDFESAMNLTEKYISKRFKRMHDGKFSQEEHLSKPKFCKKFKDLEQSNICIGFPSYEFATINELKINILSTIFGGGMSSRLFQKIRESMGLCYTVYSYPSAYKRTGLLSMYLGTNPDKVESAVKAMFDEIRQLKTDGITEAEFQKAKEQLKTALILGQESSSSIMRAYGKYMLFENEIYDIDKRLKNIADLTIDDINSIIGEVFDFSKMSASYVGKKTDFNPLKIV